MRQDTVTVGAKTYDFNWKCKES